ncbi:MAG: glycosyltransferase family 39 protein [Campylobacterota bacterium]|nr:glycosyltransferase family 39 protein [Campylobacterota bacterium]
MRLNRYNLTFAGLLSLHLLLLFFMINDFSISAKEADIYFKNISLISFKEFFSNNIILIFLTNLSTDLFGQNDIALRLPFILFYVGSSILLYLLTDDYFKSQWDRVLTIAIFMMLPGVNSAALLVNESIIVVFFTLLYLYLYKLKEKEHYYLLILFLFIDNSFAILFLSLFFYSMKKKDNTLLFTSLILFGVSMTIYGFEIGGRPRGYFLDTFAVYATIFSPLMFLYFFYSLYRVGLKGEKDMYWYISMTALFLSLLFSLRQKIDIEDFAPFVVIAIPIMVKLFMHSIRVRLKEFRQKHYIAGTIVISVLVLNFFVFIFNKYLFLIIENPAKHIAYKHYIAKELSNQLKAKNIYNIKVEEKGMAKRLKFYHIKNNEDNYKLVDNLNTKEKINIKYKDKIVKSYGLIRNNYR